jgi:hypothetical protein
MLSQLPEAVLNAPENIDRECAVIRDRHRRMGNLTARFNRRSEGDFYVINEPVRPNYRLFRVVHWRSYSDHPVSRQRGGSCITESGVRFTESYVDCRRIR